MKVAMMGLDASGKTSFLSTIKKKYSVLWNLKPTKGVERDIFSFLNQEIALWDYGGQAKYRRKYLRSFNQYLADLQLIFYLVDITAPQRLDESLEYLQEILSCFNSANLPHLIICLHKYDPDLRKNSQIQNTAQNSKEKIAQIVSNALYFETSIFDENSLWKVFSKGIQKLATGDEILFNYLEEIATETSARGISLLDTQGMTVSSYVLDDDADFVLESCTPSFLDVWKSIKIRGLNPGLVDFDIANGTAVFSPLTIPNFTFFILAYFLKGGQQKSFLDQKSQLEAKISAIIGIFFTGRD
ncbi:MAG: ADP-ribosylation factor-like protein [Promethearchaeota archaeon]